MAAQDALDVPVLVRVQAPQPSRVDDRRLARERFSGHGLRSTVVTAPVVVILAAGQGTRMRSATPKLLHPLCGRPMIAWPVTAAREAGAGKVVVVDGPARPLASARWAGQIATQQRPQGRPMRSGRRPHIAPGSPGGVLAGDVPLISPTRFARLRDPTCTGAAATMATRCSTIRAVTDASFGPRMGRSSGSSRRRPRATRPSSSSRSVRSTRASCVRGRELWRRSRRSERQRPGRAVPARRAADPAAHERTVVAYEIADPRDTLGVNDRAGLRGGQDDRAAADPRPPHARGRDDRRSGRDRDRRHVRDRRDTVIAPFSSLHGSTGSGPARRSDRCRP